MNDKNCSSKNHSNIKAIIYCKECNLYLCNKCQYFHLELHGSHNVLFLNNDTSEIFTGFCNQKEHNLKLIYFCKTHNELCCAACLCKIKGQGNGQHKDCSVVFITEIKDEKKNKLNENINTLEKLSISLDKTIKELKIIVSKINENKEELKLKIQKVFTKIRNELNNKEDELILDIDKKFEENYFSEDIIKKSEKLPEKVEYCLKKGKSLEKDWKVDDLSNIINDCIQIEKNITNINVITKRINQYNINSNVEINLPDEDDINIILGNIKYLGAEKIYLDSNIIQKYEDKKMISNWINPESKITYKLLYRASRDEDKISTFTEKVSGKFPTLIIIQTKLGFKFGGFTTVEWNMTGSYSYKKDKLAFLFSIDKRKKYNQKKDMNTAICGDPNHFAFGGHDLSIVDSCMTKNDNYISIGHTYEAQERHEPNGGERDFCVRELEVFEIIIN